MNNIAKGSIFALIGFFFMALFGIVTKIAIQETSVIWVSFIAYVAGTFSLIPYVVKKGIGYLKSEHYLYLIGRAIFGTAASFLYSMSINYIPIVNGTLLFNTAPIFIPILMVVFLKIKIERIIWFAVVLGFLGITIIIKPTAEIFKEGGNLIALFSGISLAIAYLLMKLLTSTDPGVRIIFYYLGLGTLLQLPVLFFAGPFPTLEIFFYAIGSGIILLLAQLALVKGYTYADASEIGIYQYSSVAFVGILDWIIWGMVPTISEAIGILIVACAGVIIIRYGNNQKKLSSKQGSKRT